MIDLLAREAKRFADVLGTVPAATPVPTCPGWDASDLLWHLTEVHYFWAGVLANGVTTEDGADTIHAAIPRRPTSIPEILSLRELATHELVGMLALLSDDEPRWSWWPPDQTVGFTRRMQTAEVVMHRIDAELTARAEVSPIAPDVAVGIVTHAVDVMWGWQPDETQFEALGVVEFVAHEGEHWLVDVGRFGAQPAALRAVDGHPSVTVRGTAEELARWAWGRRGRAHVEGVGPARSGLDAVVAHGIR